MSYKDKDKDKDKEIQWRNTYRKTLKGWVTRRYVNMKYNSKQRNMDLPNFTKKEFSQWVSEQPHFKKLWDGWVNSNYDKKLSPSINRLDDYKPYIFDNMELTTWEDNDRKGRLSYKFKNAQKIYFSTISKVVVQLSKNGVFINTFDSIAGASKTLNIHSGHISSCCKGKLRTSGGFKWLYEEEYKKETNHADTMVTI
jgi:hypothetical protein